MSLSPSISTITQSADTRDETGAATAMKHDILHSVGAADFVESVPDAILIVDEQGRIVTVNTLAEKLFGYRRGELLGELVEKPLVPERFPNRLIELPKAVLRRPPPMDRGSRPGVVRPTQGRQGAFH